MFPSGTSLVELQLPAFPFCALTDRSHFRLFWMMIAFRNDTAKYLPLHSIFPWFSEWEHFWQHFNRNLWAFNSDCSYYFPLCIFQCSVAQWSHFVCNPACQHIDLILPAEKIHARSCLIIWLCSRRSFLLYLVFITDGASAADSYLTLSEFSAEPVKGL